MGSFRGVLQDAALRDELEVFRQVARFASESARILLFFKLGRGIIRDVTKIPPNGRQAQITFNSIVSATRLKYFIASEIIPTACPRPGCGKVDSLEHPRRCDSHEREVQGGWDGIEFLARMAIRAKPAPRGMPRPIVPGGAAQEVFYVSVRRGAYSVSRL